jgi:tetratricopeptide (TPR) repeat protein/CHAT domain-containing protein
VIRHSSLAVLSAFFICAASWAIAQQATDEVGALRDRVRDLHAQIKFGEATPIAERYAALALEKHGRDSIEWATAEWWLAEIYDAQARYVDAEPHFKQALLIYERTLGSSHNDVATLLNNLANMYGRMARPAEAEPLHRRALQIRKETLGLNHLLTAGSLQWLADTLIDLDRDVEAEAFARDALELREKLLGPEHRDVAYSLNQYALVMEEQSRWSEAEPFLRRALEIREKVLGPEHSHTGFSAHRVAGNLRSQKRYAEAETFYKRAINIRTKALGRENAETADSVQALADNMFDMGRDAEFETHSREALQLREKILGGEHPLVAYTLNQLGLAMEQQGRLAEAEPLLRRAFAIREKVLGPTHSFTGFSCQRLADNLKSQGRFTDAEAMFHRAIEIRTAALGRENVQTAESIQSLADTLLTVHRHAEAEPLSREALRLRVKLIGPENVFVAYTLNQLALSVEEQGRAQEAGQLLQRALAIREKVLGPEHAHTAFSSARVADNLKVQGRYAEAESFYQRALAIREKTLGAEHIDVATNLDSIGMLHQSRGRYAEALPLYERALAIKIKAIGPQSASVATSYNHFGLLLTFQGKYAEAEENYRKALAIQVKLYGEEHADVAVTLNNLALLHDAQGRYLEAEKIYKKSLTISEKLRGPEHAEVATTLDNLGKIYQVLSRYREAEPLFLRAMRIKEKTRGLDHPDLATTLNNLAQVYRAEGRYSEAEPLYKRGLAIYEKQLGPDHHWLGITIDNLAQLYQAQGRNEEAEPLFKRSLSIKEKSLGAEHPDVAISLNNLARLYTYQGKFDDAEPLYKRSLELHVKMRGADHPEVAITLDNLAQLYYAKGDWRSASEYWHRSTSVLTSRTERGATSSGVVSDTKSDAERSNWQFKGLVKASFRLAAEGAADVKSLEREMFETAQWALGSEAAASLVQMSTRAAKGDSALAALVRERQDKIAEWQAKDKELIARKGEALDKRDLAAEKVLSQRMDAIDTRISQIDAELQRDFPDYAALASPKPASLADIQSQLKDSEALIQFLDTFAWSGTPEETFIWVITKADSRWVRSPLGSNALQNQVAALRCGLDGSAWAGEGAALCKSLLGNQYAPPEPGKRKALPFDIARGYFLYRSLFGDVEDMIRGKSLLIVPSGALTSLPFQVLVTAPPDGIKIGEVSRDIALLGAEFGELTPEFRQQFPQTTNRGVTVVSIVKGGAAENAGLLVNDVVLSIHGINVLGVQHGVETVRSNPPGSNVTLDILRNGQEISLNVTLGSTSLTEWVPLFADKSQTNVAWLIRQHDITILPSSASLRALRQNAKTSPARAPYVAFGDPVLTRSCNVPKIPEKCPGEDVQVAAVESGITRSAGDVDDADSYFRGGLADVAAVKTRLCPLPDSAFEVRCVAKSLGAGEENLVLRGDMTETAVKHRRLDHFRIIHFATHGLLAGQSEKLAKARAEPALVFTPPEVATEEDDGLLTASEVAGLNLDADWVIMSACNTAGGGTPGAEAFSGLAKAFFYAGARSLLVSHWPVNSYAATMMVSHTFSELSNEPKMARSEAFRRAMLALMSDTKRPWAAHPSIWAPFVVVGEGGAAGGG